MDIVSALASVASYDGWHDTLCDMRDHIKKEMAMQHSSEYWNIAKPDFLQEINPDMYPCVIWFIMVEMFGDCGCSPRTGWIDGDKATSAMYDIAFQYIPWWKEIA